LVHLRNFLIAQLGRFCLQSCRHQFHSWVGKLCWRRDKLPTLPFFGIPGGSAVAESTFNVGCLGLIPGLGRTPGVRKGYPLHILAWRIPWTV